MGRERSPRPSVTKRAPAWSRTTFVPTPRRACRDRRQSEFHRVITDLIDLAGEGPRAPQFRSQAPKSRDVAAHAKCLRAFNDGRLEYRRFDLGRKRWPIPAPEMRTDQPVISAEFLHRTPRQWLEFRSAAKLITCRRTRWSTILQSRAARRETPFLSGEFVYSYLEFLSCISSTCPRY